MPIQVTTELPDEDQPVIGNGVEDEVAVDRESAVSNYGSVRIQIRETGEAAWDSSAAGFSEFIGAFDTLSMEFVGREDGEEYEVRARTETEHITGAWTTPVAIITQFPGVTNLQATGSTQTTVDLEGQDNADNESGFRVYRQREYDSGWGPWREVADINPNDGTGTLTHTDDTASPGNTYRYKIEAYTPHASAESNETGAVDTTASGRPRTWIHTSGWTVQIEHPSGQTLRPQLLDDPQFTPMLKALPRVEIPVPRNEKWQAAAFEDAPLSVWQDGRILPIDELVTVRMKEDRTVLVGRGGSELKNRVQAEFDDYEAHLAARDLGQANTSYTMNVDDPASGTQPNTLMQSGDMNSELRDALAAPIADTDPVEIADSRLNLLDSMYVSEAENPTTSTDPFFASDGAYSGGNAQGVYTSASENVYDFNLEYTIPGSEVGVWFRTGATDDAPACQIILEVNGTENVLDSLSGGEGVPLQWNEFADGDGFNGPGYGGGDIGPDDTVRVIFRGDGTAGGSLALDVVALGDQRFPYFFDDDNGGSGGPLQGPQLKPDSFEVVFADVPTAFNVDAGQITVVMDDISGTQALALSNDQGANYLPAGGAANTDSLSVDFPSAGSSIRWKVTLSRYGTQSGSTPTQGIFGQSIDSFELRADLEDTPVLDEQSYDGALIDVFNQIAEYGNFIWEVRRTSVDEWSIEWTQPGQREADSDADIANYQVSKSTENRAEKAVIKGGAQPVNAEEFPAQHDTWVSLDQSELVPGKDEVRDPDTNTRFELGLDYKLDRTGGRIKALSGGGMADGSVYEINYEFKPIGSYTAADAGSDPDEIVRTISSLASNRACEQAALYLIQRIQDPQWKAEVTVSKLDAGVSLVDDLAIAGLPTQGVRTEVQDIQQSPAQVVLHLGNWTSPGDVLNDFESRISSVSELV